MVMFDKFSDTQSVAYSIFYNSVRDNKLSHAYLIDGNNDSNALEFVMSLVKLIVCKDHYSNYNKCGNCNICSRIDEGNYMEVKVIESDSLIIKKEQLLELQSEFSKVGIEGRYRVYVIKDCDKMNKQASNCLLKFLEEPEEGIIAILFTNHIDRILSTIKSRCQLIRLVNNNVYCDSTIVNFANFYCDDITMEKDFINDVNNMDKINSVVDFVKYFEDNGLDVMIYLKKMWYNIFKSRDDNIVAVNLVVNFYYDVLKFKCNIDNYFFGDKLDFLEKIANSNSILAIVNKLNVCVEVLDNLKYNLNVNLLIDNMIIKLGDCCEYS